MLHSKARYAAVVALCTLSAYANDELRLIVDKQCISCPKELDAEITHYNNKFFVNGMVVQNHNLSQELRNAPTKDVAQLLAAGSYLKLHKDSSNKYAIDLQKKLNGSGVVTGWFLYGLTKSLGYGIPVVVAGKVIQRAAEEKSREVVEKSMVYAVETGTAFVADSVCNDVVPAIFNANGMMADNTLSYVKGFDAQPHTIMSPYTQSVLNEASVVVTPATAQNMLVSLSKPIPANHPVMQGTREMMNTMRADALQSFNRGKMGGFVASEAAVNAMGKDKSEEFVVAVGTASGGVIGYIGAVEKASLWAWVFGSSIIWLP